MKSAKPSTQTSREAKAGSWTDAQGITYILIAAYTRKNGTQVSAHWRRLPLQVALPMAPKSTRARRISALTLAGAL